MLMLLILLVIIVFMITCLFVNVVYYLPLGAHKLNNARKRIKKYGLIGWYNECN